MEKSRICYNGISANYNLRYEVDPMPGISKTLQTIISSHKPKKILEVGCGTGRWLSTLNCYEAVRTGIDSSRGMLQQAVKNSHKLNLICADANSLPFSDKRFDMIYCVNAIHHFRDKKEFLRTAANLLELNGTLSIIGVDPHYENDNWYIYDFFNGVLEKDLLRFPSFDEITGWMDQLGLKQIARSTAERVVNDRIGEDVFNDTFLRKDQSSQLALLSDSEYSIGIDKIKHAVKINPFRKFPVRLTFQSITGSKT